MEEQPLIETPETQEPKVIMKKPKRTLKFLAVFGIIVLALVLFSSGYVWGYNGNAIIKQKLVSIDPPVKYKNVDFSKFWEAFQKIEDNYVGQIDYNKLVEGAIHGMVSGLDDPFSVYMDKNQLNDFNGEITGTFEGIGTEISAKNGNLVVVAPIEGSPAEKAGLKAGDIIKLIDGQTVENMTIDEAISKIRGKKDTAVTLNILRTGNDKPFDVKINRDVINVKSVRYKLENGIANIRILRFDQETSKLVDDAAGDMIKNGAKGLILDLRNDPGGYLESSIDVASEFIKDGIVVIEEYKDGRRDNNNTTGKGKLFDIPMVVLVNGGSASASEIVAGAIKDHKRGALIGEKTFGKGSVQEMQPLSLGGALKITMAHWLTPNGTGIDKNGLMPDIEVKWVEGDKDVQLEKAKEELKKIIK